MIETGDAELLRLDAEFKAACDTYFYLKHRAEPRGIGGVFFDDLENAFEVMRAVGDSFLDAYLPIHHRRLQPKFLRDLGCQGLGVGGFEHHHVAADPRA